MDRARRRHCVVGRRRLATGVVAAVTSLTLLTGDPRAADAQSVEVAWNGVVESSAQARSRAVYTPPADPQPSTIPTDPGVPGPFEVTETDYDLGAQAIALEGLGGRLGELKARVYAPVNATRTPPVSAVPARPPLRLL